MAKSIPKYAADKLPKDLLAAVGEVIVRWGRLEYQVHRLLCVGFEVPNEAGRALTIGMSISSACATLRTLAAVDHWITDKKIRARIKDLQRDIQGEAERRHELAHGVFGFDLDTPNDFARYTFRLPAHKVVPDSIPVDLNDLHELAETARALVERTIDLTVSVKAHHDSRK
jgi:hypothetical protein